MDSTQQAKWHQQLFLSTWVRISLLQNVRCETCILCGFIEDHNGASINASLFSGWEQELYERGLIDEFNGKLWMLADANDMEKVRSLIFSKEELETCSAVDQHRRYLPHPREIAKHVPVLLVWQSHEDIVVTGSAGYHCGVNRGLTYNAASNFFPKTPTVLKMAYRYLQDTLSKPCAEVCGMQPVVNYVPMARAVINNDDLPASTWAVKPRKWVAETRFEKVVQDCLNATQGDSELETQTLRRIRSLERSDIERFRKVRSNEHGLDLITNIFGEDQSDRIISKAWGLSRVEMLQDYETLFSDTTAMKRLCKKAQNMDAVSGDDSRFVCYWNGCDKSFSRNADMIRHVKSVHLKQKPHMCPQCAKRFTEAHHLKKHVGNVHRNVNDILSKGKSRK